MNLGSIDGNGADGIVFVLQTVGTSALGTSGGGMGFKGFAPAFGIEFDTYQNTDQGDPSYDHCAFLKNGNTDHRSGDNISGPVQISKSATNVEDSRDHHVIVEWNATSKTISMFYDCELRLTSNADLVKTIFNGKNNVYWGFTAATGGSINNQVVCLRKDIIVKDSFTICRGGQVEISAGQSIDNVYSWSPNQFISSTNGQKTTVNPVNSGFYTATYKNYCNQTVQDKIWVQVSGGPKIDLGRDTMLCNGQSLTVKLNPSGLKTIVWDNGTSMPDRTLANAGTYWVKVTDTANCISSDTLIIQASAQPTVNLGKDTLLCDGEILWINLNTPYKILWEDNSTLPNRQIDKAGIYSVGVSNPCGEARDTLIVGTKPAPNLNLGEDTSLCLGQLLNLNITDPSILVCQWQDGTTNFNYQISKEGKYFVDVNGTNGCKNNDTILVSYILPPEADFPADTVVCRNEILKLEVKGRELEVSWNGIPGNETYEVSNFIGNLQMTAKNNCGTISRDINVQTENCFCAVHFPNAITLNDDGLNESFGPVYDCIWKQYQLIIYNRWGEKVFESTQPDVFWDGKYKNAQVANGYYLWIANYTAFENTVPVMFQQKGVVYILK